MEPRPDLPIAARSWAPPAAPKKALSAKEVGHAIGVSERHVRTLIDRGELPSIKVGACVRVLVADLDAYLAGLRSSR